MNRYYSRYSINISNSKLILISVVSAILLAYNFYLPILISCFVVSIALYYILGQNIIVPLSIFILLTSTSTIFPEARVYIIVAVYSVLILFFLKEYGSDLKNYPKIPLLLQQFLVVLFASLLISTFYHFDALSLGLAQIIRLLSFFIIVFCIYGNIKGDKQIRQYLLAMFAVSIIYLFVIFEVLRSNNFNLIDMQLNEIIRGSSFLNLNSMGAFFLITGSVLLALIFNKSFRYRTGAKILFLLNCFGLILINSRGALLAFIFSILIILFYLNRKILTKMVFGMLLSIPIFFIPPVDKYVSLFFRLNPQVLTGRDLIFENIIEIIKNNWLLGTGPAGTKIALYKYLPFMLGSPQELFISRHYEMIQFGHAHNFYLFFFSDLGLPGLIVSLFLLYVFYKIAFKVFSHYKHSHEKYLVIGIIAAATGLFIRGLFEWGNLISYGQITTDLPFWIIFSILCFYHSRLNHVVENNKSFPVK